MAAQRDAGAGLDAASAAIRAIRKAKSEAGLSQRAEVARGVVRGRGSELALLRRVMSDVVAAGNIARVDVIEVNDLDDE